MISSLSEFKNPFFIGIAGSGMSALAQYLQGIGKNVSGSDRYFKKGEFNETKKLLEAEGIKCYLQDGEGITDFTDLVVASTAIEDTVIEVQKARQLGIPVIKRSELLALIAGSKKTIAIGGTSGKSTTTAMLFDILEYAGMRPSIISGAGLVSIIKEEKIGNAKVGMGDWLVIEADESDGSIVQYKPEIGVLLNIDKDHKEIETLMEIFTSFKKNSRRFIVNQSHSLARQLSQDIKNDFSTDEKIPAGYTASNFTQQGLSIQFTIHLPTLKLRQASNSLLSAEAQAKAEFTIHTVGKHNMENALAAIAVANQLGVDLDACATALEKYEGIYRRHQLLGNKNGVWLIDDYAHNPAKCAASIEACQSIAPKVIAWFQPHGYVPTKFLRDDFVNEIARVLRPEDEIWMSEIFYAGGTTTKDISSNDLIMGIRAMGKNAFFVENRKFFLEEVRGHLSNNCVLLMMGARDPSLEQFAQSIWKQL